MSTDPTLAEIKQMLAGMLKVTVPKQRVLTNQKEETLDHIYAELVNTCVTHGASEVIFRHVLEGYRHGELIYRWKIINFPEYFLVKIEFHSGLCWHDITISKSRDYYIKLP